MIDETTKTKLRRLFEDGFNEEDFSLVDELIDVDYVDHSTMQAPGPGPEGFKGRIMGLKKAFPDVHFTVDDVFGEGDRAALLWRVTGTDLGGFADRPPSGNKIDITGINVERLAGGKVVEHWSSPDNLGLMRQLGMIP